MIVCALKHATVALSRSWSCPTCPSQSTWASCTAGTVCGLPFTLPDCCQVCLPHLVFRLTSSSSSNPSRPLAANWLLLVLSRLRHTTLKLKIVLQIAVDVVLKFSFEFFLEFFLEIVLEIILKFVLMTALVFVLQIALEFVLEIIIKIVLGVRARLRTALNTKEWDGVWNNRGTIVSHAKNILRLQQEPITSLNGGALTKDWLFQKGMT